MCVYVCVWRPGVSSCRCCRCLTAVPDYLGVLLVPSEAPTGSTLMTQGAAEEEAAGERGAAAGERGAAAGERGAGAGCRQSGAVNASNATARPAESILGRSPMSMPAASSVEISAWGLKLLVFELVHEALSC
jgi:hypothetical protein